MKALHTMAAEVPWSRVLREHRAALLPLGVALAVNLAVLLLVVLPLSQRVDSNDARALTAERAQQAAEAEFRQAEALREGKQRATTDLDTFYRDVLPAGVSAARRLLDLQIRQLAESHQVRFQRGAANEEEIRSSALNRLVYTMSFTGDWDDIRAFIYDLETSPNFVIIDNIALAEGLGGDDLTLSLELSTYYRDAVRAAALRTDGR